MEEPENKETKWPLRVEKIIESYKQASKELSKTAGKKISVSYIPETIDLHERVWEYRASLKPESRKVTINDYRIRHKEAGVHKNEDHEYYIYSATKTCNTANDRIAVFTYDRYGFHRAVVLALDHNVENRSAPPKVVAYKHCFWLPWNKEEVKQLLGSSDIKCQQFYVGNSASIDPIEDRRYSIQNQEDFLDGSFDENPYV